jgi:hypothetical protein
MRSRAREPTNQLHDPMQSFDFCATIPGCDRIAQTQTRVATINPPEPEEDAIDGKPNT